VLPFFEVLLAKENNQYVLQISLDNPPLNDIQARYPKRDIDPTDDVNG